MLAPTPGPVNRASRSRPVELGGNSNSTYASTATRPGGGYTCQARRADRYYREASEALSADSGPAVLRPPEQQLVVVPVAIEPAPAQGIAPGCSRRAERVANGRRGMDSPRTGRPL